MTKSRLEPARRRATGAKQALTVVAAVSFAAALLLARGTHAGSTVLSPSGGGAVQVQTHVS